MARAKSRIKNARSAVKDAAGRAQSRVRESKGPSPNPMTNLVLADIALRAGGAMMRRGMERGMLGLRYSPEKAKDIVKGRTLTQTLLTTALARVATRSVPGAILVGGGMLAKTLYDRSKSRREAVVEGERDLQKMADKA